MAIAVLLSEGCQGESAASEAHARKRARHQCGLPPQAPVKVDYQECSSSRCAKSLKSDIRQLPIQAEADVGGPLQCDAVELSGAVVEACATEMMLKSFERERECLEPAVTSKAKLPYSEGATPATAGLSALKMFEGFALLQSLLGILCQLKCTMEVGRKVLRLGLRRRPERVMLVFLMLLAVAPAAAFHADPAMPRDHLPVEAPGWQIESGSHGVPEPPAFLLYMGSNGVKPSAPDGPMDASAQGAGDPGTSAGGAHPDTRASKDKGGKVSEQLEKQGKTPNPQDTEQEQAQWMTDEALTATDEQLVASKCHATLLELKGTVRERQASLAAADILAEAQLQAVINERDSCVRGNQEKLNQAVAANKLQMSIMDEQQEHKDKMRALTKTDRTRGTTLSAKGAVVRPEKGGRQEKLREEGRQPAGLPHHHQERQMQMPKDVPRHFKNHLEEEGHLCNGEFYDRPVELPNYCDVQAPCSDVTCPARASTQKEGEHLRSGGVREELVGARSCCDSCVAATHGNICTDCEAGKYSEMGYHGAGSVSCCGDGKHSDAGVDHCLDYLPIFACLAKDGLYINAQLTEPPQADCTMMPFNTGTYSDAGVEHCLDYLPIFACLAKGGNCINAQPTEPPQADCTMMPFNTDACANTNGNIVTQHVCTSVAGNLGMDYDADGSNVIENCNDSSILTMHNGDDGCDWYVGRRSSCGDHDDADFDPEADCCTCTGGLNAPILTPAPSSPSSEGEPRMSQRVK